MISRLSDSALRALSTRLRELAIALSQLASTSSISLVTVVRRWPYSNDPDYGPGAPRIGDVYARDTTLRGRGETSGSELETVFLLPGKAIPRISSIDRMRDARAHFTISCLKDSGLRRASNLESVARRTTSKSYDGGLVRGLDIQRLNGNVPTRDTQGPDSERVRPKWVCLGWLTRCGNGIARMAAGQDKSIKQAAQRLYAAGASLRL